jgi:hypothetical protein
VLHTVSRCCLSIALAIELHSLKVVLHETKGFEVWRPVSALDISGCCARQPRSNLGVMQGMHVSIPGQHLRAALVMHSHIVLHSTSTIDFHNHVILTECVLFDLRHKWFHVRLECAVAVAMWQP